VELLALMLQLWLVFGAGISELISAETFRAEPRSALCLGHAMTGPLEVTREEDTSIKIGGLHRKPQAMVHRWALFASL
jgi:hypothetical protein